jgi:hypothetical protein
MRVTFEQIPLLSAMSEFDGYDDARRHWSR